MKRVIWLMALLSLIIFPGLAAAVDCRLGAGYYYQAKFETDPQQAIEWLNRSVEVCPNFNAWYMLGLTYTQLGEIDPAMAAFMRARTRAVSSKTEALALARQGELLARSGQMPRALYTLELAKRFHPEPVPAWMEASLKNTRIKIQQSLITAADITQVFASGVQTSRDGRFAVRPALNLPVHFDFDRADLNAAGTQQVIELGLALSDAKMKQWSFLLVGHTDKRGTMDYNQTLSENRAYTVKRELERRFPSLSARLEARGRGESELLYDGDSEEDHMLNRRVKVTLY
ncbi:MAG: OmpA family protein [Desulfobacterales bacterium]|nr:MAG: OmpA family protein [Desulfobacterales bacterium]